MRNVLRELVARLGHLRAFALLDRHVIVRIDRAVLRLTGGRVALSGVVFPVLTLTTTGRRTGLPRTTPVIYARAHGGYLVSCEDFGDPSRRSAWPRNLLADPSVEVNVGGETIACRARALTGSELEAHWPAPPGP